MTINWSIIENRKSGMAWRRSKQISYHIMNKFVFVFFTILLMFKYSVSDQEMTVTVEPGTEECFYEHLGATGTFELDYQVIDGAQGELDISFYLTGPDGRPIIMEQKKADNSHRIEVPVSGNYRFCFDNRFSSFNRKTVFFALYSENEESDNWENINTATEEEYEITVAEIEEAVHRVKDHLTQIRHMQEQVRAWEARDRNIAESNFARVNHWSMVQITVMLVVGFVQVVMLKSLFDEQSKLSTFFRTRRSKW